MKLAIDVKCGSKVLNPMDGSVILYEGGKYYVTTKEELFKEITEKCENLVSNCEQKYNDLLAEWKKFLTDYTTQNEKLIKVIDSVVEK